MKVKSKQSPDSNIHRCRCATCRKAPGGPIAEEHRAINRLVACADERSRRLLVGFLAQQQGRGGIALLARITGLDRNTIASGQRELAHSDLAPRGRVRKPGAGRKCVEDQSPES
jgi:hypothetical protein